MSIDADLRDAIAELIDTTNRWPRAHTTMHSQLAGYAATAAGFSEGGGGGAAVKLTRPEAVMEAVIASENFDKSRADLTQAARSAAIIRKEARRILEIAERYNPDDHPPTRKKATDTPAADPGDDYCRSCFTDDGYLECVTLRTERQGGTPYYVGLCKWCGDFRANWKKDPPPAVLRARHQGKRITVQLIERAMIEAKAKGKQRRR